MNCLGILENLLAELIWLVILFLVGYVWFIITRRSGASHSPCENGDRTPTPHIPPPSAR